jgi:predicted DNA-binding protein (MmcQ/YjbR family)
MDQKTVENYILSLPNTWSDYPFGKEVVVYKVGAQPDGSMFALIANDKQPLRLSLRCDPELAKVLRGKYEEIMPGYRLSPKQWNTLVLSGQLTWSEVQDLIQHSYQLAIK